ncbi:hypothetical protein P5673_020179, partial [Acropora cervicornis]
MERKGEEIAFSGQLQFNKRRRREENDGKAKSNVWYTKRIMVNDSVSIWAPRAKFEDDLTVLEIVPRNSPSLLGY